MGIREVKDSFNLVANPDASASRALLSYQSMGGTQYQFLKFFGSWSDGAPFEIRSELIRPNGDPVLMARSTASALLAQRGIQR